jgi:hypothetical protein
MTTAPARKTYRPVPDPQAFGENVTADHVVINEHDEGVDGERAALVILDRGTGWIDCYPVADKTAEESVRALGDFVGPTVEAANFYSDNSPELIRAARDLSWVHGTATPGRPATNGVAERAVRSVLEGTRTVLEQAGLPHKFWPYACRHWCFSHNVQTREGNSPWHKRHNKGKFKGKRIPFGSLVDFLPSPIRGGVPKFASRTQPGFSWGTSCCVVADGRGMCLLPLLRI